VNDNIQSTPSVRLPHGLFVTFEGIDGSGKSTQMQLCAKTLEAQGYSVVLTRNPGGTEFGQELREILLHSTKPVSPISELLLFIADRAQHMDEVVFPALAQGKIILCDRHMDSTLAYQGYGRSLPLETIQTLNQIAIQTRKPDITFLLDGPPDVLAQRVTQRGKADRLEGEVQDFHIRVRRGYLALAEAEPERIQVFNALESPPLLHQQLMQILMPLLNPPVLR
jgi:dTMP kinase